MEAPRQHALDLRGVRCPLNWARAKVYLEQLAPGVEVELWLDDPKGARDIPGAAEAEGYDVLRVEVAGDSWRIVVAT